MKSPTITFVTDNPITTGSEDLLNRQRFAESIAKGILSWDRKASSLVVAIYGEWGSGKTSVKNLVFEELADRVEPVQFNPWAYSGEGDLTTAFFGEIARAIYKLDQSDDKAVADGFRTWTNVASHSNAKDPEVPKTSLRLDLSEFKKPIVVAVDDIDRLTAHEIRLLFQMMKANTDFPNLAFIVLCQREIVENSLAESLPKGLDISFPVGRAFLNKIVHVSVTVPRLKFEKAEQMLVERLTPLIPPTLIQPKDNLEIVISVIAPLFSNLRQIIRFQSAYSFQLGLFIENENKYIDPLDLLLMESLRQFAPECFDLLAINTGRIFGPEEEGEPDQLISELLALVRPAQYGIVKGILYCLFPYAIPEGEDYVRTRSRNSPHTLTDPKALEGYFEFTAPSKELI